MKSIYALLLPLVLATPAFSQDEVYQKDGNVLTVHVKEVLEESIKFSYLNETLINNLSTEKIDKIVFSSGREQIFSSTAGYETYGLNLEEPKFIGEIFLIDSDVNLVELEKQKASAKVAASASTYLVGVGKATAKNVVDGASSPVIVSAGSQIKILVKVRDNEYDPKDEINIFPLEVKRRSRFIEVGSASTFGQTKVADIEFVDFNAKKYGASSFLITIDSLSPGEYAITLKDSREVFNMFSVQ